MTSINTRVKQTGYAVIVSHAVDLYKKNLKVYHREYKRRKYAESAEFRRKANISANKAKTKLKNNARSRVRYALKKGVLVRMPCEICGEAKTQGHHQDYNRPLEVNWLCGSCHKDVHLGVTVLAALT